MGGREVRGEEEGRRGKSRRPPTPPKDQVGLGGSGGGKPLAGTRESHTLTCPSPSPPARRRLRAAAGRARTQGARTRTAGLFLELALRPFSPSPAHSKPGARSVAAAVASAQLPWPPPPRETLPRPLPLRPPGRRFSVVSRPSLPHPAQVLSGPIDERLRVRRLG